MKDELHIGATVKSVLTKQGRKASWLAKQLPCERTYIYRIFKKETLPVQQLYKISKILDYNFLELYGQDLKKNIGNQNIPTIE
jgi:hypothetical protein